MTIKTRKIIFCVIGKYHLTNTNVEKEKEDFLNQRLESESEENSEFNEGFITDHLDEFAECDDSIFLNIIT